MAELLFLDQYGNLNPMNTVTDTDPKKLRPLLHAEIDKLRDEDLPAVHPAPLETEARRLADQLDAATDQAWKSGQIIAEKITEAIREHRREQPYK